MFGLSIFRQDDGADVRSLRRVSEGEHGVGADCFVENLIELSVLEGLLQREVAEDHDQGVLHVVFEGVITSLDHIAFTTLVLVLFVESVLDLLQHGDRSGVLVHLVHHVEVLEHVFSQGLIINHLNHMQQGPQKRGGGE